MTINIWNFNQHSKNCKLLFLKGCAQYKILIFFSEEGNLDVFHFNFQFWHNDPSISICDILYTNVCLNFAVYYYNPQQYLW